jgi:hypothetical protein
MTDPTQLEAENKHLRKMAGYARAVLRRALPAPQRDQIEDALAYLEADRTPAPAGSPETEIGPVS